MPKLPQAGTRSADTGRPAGRPHFLASFFPIPPNTLTDLAKTGRHTVMFGHHRAHLILSRVRLMAMLFATLTPLWIPFDVLVFPQSVWRALIFGRLVSNADFLALGLRCRHATTLKTAYVALGALFFIGSALFLFAHAVLAGVSLSRSGATIASSYAFLPFVIMAGLSLFPLTLLELGALALPLLMVFSIPVVERSAFMVPTFDATAILWLLTLVAAVGGLSAVSQLQILHSLFATSVIDPLTGVFNRGSGTELIALQVALAQRQGYPLAIAFLDLDDFKQVNDGAGHESGDKLLKETAQSWRAALRKSDAVLRWGGEEFLLVLPYTDCPCAERLLRHRLPALQRPDGKPLTFSIGIA